MKRKTAMQHFLSEHPSDLKLARELGVTRQTINNWRRSKVPPSVDNSRLIENFSGGRYKAADLVLGQ